jgi:KUP system potassium uptake protein
MFTNPGVTFVILGAIVLCQWGRGPTPTHGTLRHQTDPAGVVFGGHARAGAQLFWPGALLLSNPEAVKNPFYLMILSVAAHGGPGHHGHER